MPTNPPKKENTTIPQTSVLDQIIEKMIPLLERSEYFNKDLTGLLKELLIGDSEPEEIFQTLKK